MIRGQSTTTIYPVGNYSFGTKPAKVEKDTAVGQRMERLKEKYVVKNFNRYFSRLILLNNPYNSLNSLCLLFPFFVRYAKEGVRKSVDAVLLVYEHGHPHVLLLQVGASFFKLPGGRLRPGEGGKVLLYFFSF